MSTHWNHHVKATLIYSLVACLSCPHPSIAVNIEIDRRLTNKKLGCINETNCLSTTLDITENGNTPIVNISRPNTDGLSYNVFSKYNVDQNGVLINNDTNMGISHVEKHRYMKNPNLHDQTASKILFSVSGTGKSRLEGYTEVVGADAHLMVSNPNGIFINGAGFINVSILGLTTGIVTDTNGQILSDVNRGSIEFGSYGLDLSDVDYTAVLAKSYQQVGTITNANKVDVILGSNIVSIKDDDSIIEQSRVSVSALDAVRLGSIYANTIFVKSTDQGVGVYSDGLLLAKNGDLELSANGDLIYNDLIAKNDISVNTSHNLESNGSTYSDNGRIDLSADQISISGEASDQLVGDRIKIHSNQLESQIVTIQGESIDLDVDNIQLSDQLIMANTVNVNTPSGLRLDNTTVVAYDQLELNSNGDFVAVDSSVVSDRLLLRANSAELNNSISQTDSRLDVSVQTLQMDGASAMIASRANIESRLVENEGEISAKSIEIKATERIENKGEIVSDRNVLDDENDEIELTVVLIDAGVVMNDGEIVAERVDISATGEIINTGQMMAIRKSSEFNDKNDDLNSISASIQAQRLINDGGIIAENININADNEIVNTGQILGYRDSEFINENNSLVAPLSTLIYTDILRNDGEIVSEIIKINASNEVRNMGDVLAYRNKLGTNSREKGLFSTVSSILTTHLMNQGDIIAENIEINSTNTIKNTGNIISSRAIQKNSSKLVLRDSSRTLIETDHIVNYGNIGAEIIEINAKSGLENFGKIISNRAIPEHNYDGVIGDSMRILIETDRLVNSGDIGAEILEISAKTELENSGKIVSKSTAFQANTDDLEQNSTTIQSHTLTNSGEINSKSIEIIASGSLHNTGKILAESSLSLSTDLFENLGSTQVPEGEGAVLSTVISGEKVEVNAHHMKNSQALIASSGMLELTIQLIDNQTNGLIYSDGQLRLNAKRMNNNSASLYSVKNILINADTVLNHNLGRMESEKSILIKGVELENDSSSALIGLDGIELTLQRLKHTNQSILYSNKNIRITSEISSINESIIQTDENLSLETSQMDAISDHLDVNKLDIISEGVTLSGSNWLTRDSITINSERIDINTNSNVKGNTSVALTSNSLTVDQSKVSSDSIIIKGSDVLIKNGAIELEPTQRLSIRYGLIGNNIQLNTENLIIQNGVIYADSELNVGTNKDSLNTLAISQSSTLTSDGEMSFHSKEINLELSDIVSNGQLDIESEDIDIVDSSIQAIQLSIEGKHLTTSSRLDIVNNADISVDEWQNFGTFTSKKLRLQADRLFNGGNMIIENTMTVRGKSCDAAKFMDNSQLVYSGEGLDIQAERVRSTGSISKDAGIQSYGDLSVQANSVTFRDVSTVGNITVSPLDGGRLRFESIDSISSLGSIDIKGDEISLAMVRGNGITIESDRLQVVKGRSDGAFDLVTTHFDSQLLEQISVAGDTTININNDYRHNGLIAGLGSQFNVIIKGDFENDGTLFSAGHFNLAADQMINQGNSSLSSLQNTTFNIAGTVTNYGKLIAEKNLTINSNELENLATNSHGDVWLLKIDSKDFEIEGKRFGITIERYHTPEFRGEIVSGKDMFIDLKGFGKNHNSIISAHRDLDFNSSGLRNIANVNQRSVFYWTGGCSGVAGRICLAAPASKVILPEDLINEFILNEKGGPHLNFKSLISEYFGIEEENIPITTIPFDDVFDPNQYSKIIAGRALNMSNDFILNKGRDLGGYTNSVQREVFAPNIQPVGLGAVLTPSLPDTTNLANGSLYRVNHTPAPTKPTGETVVSVPRSNANLSDLHYTIKDPSYTKVSSNNRRDRVIHSDWVEPVPISIAVPDTQQYWYLYETVLEDVSLDGFIGSSYFLERLGTSHNDIYRLAANAMLEQEMVMKNVREAYTGGYSNDDILSTNDQMVFLYDNALSQVDALDLVLGERLSEDQINQLESDIIWLVEQTVEGMDVLVPTVYLSKVTVENLKQKPNGAVLGGRYTNVNSDKLKNSGVIFGEDWVSLESDNLDNLGEITSEGGMEISIQKELKNSGYIRSELFKSITADFLSNEGRILSGGDIGIQTKKDIRNYGNGLIKSGNITGIQSTEGGLYNTSTKDGTGILAGSNVIIETKKGIDLRYGTIGGKENLFLKSGGSLYLGNGQNIKSRSTIHTDIGSNITLHDTFKTQAGVHFKAVGKIQSKRRSGFVDVVGLRDSLNIESEKDIVLESGRHLNLKNAYIRGSSLAIYSNGDINARNASLNTVIKDHENSLKIRRNTNNKPSVSNSVESSEQDSLPSFLADLNKMANQLSSDNHQKKAADGDIMMKSERSIALNNTDLLAENSFDIESKESVNVGAETKVLVRKSGGYWRSQTQTNVTHDGANLMAKNGAGRLSAGKNLNITASQLSTSGDLKLIGKKGVNIKSATNSESKTTNKKSLGFNPYGNGFSFVSQTTSNKEDKRLVNSSLKSKGSILIGSDDELSIHGASVDAGKHLIVEGASISIATEELKNGTENDWSLKHTSSTLKAGKQLQMVAKNDINVIGSQLKGGVSYIKAGGDVSFKGAMNETYKKIVRKSGGSLFKRRKKSTHISHDQTAVSAVLTSGPGSNIIKAGSDIEFEGSTLDSMGDLVMSAGNDIRVNAGVENDYDYRKSSATGWVRKNKNETTLSRGESVASQVQTGGNLMMEAGSDIEVIGSQLEAKKDAGLKAEGTVLIATNETHYDYSQKSKSKGFLSGRKKTKTEKRQDLHQTYINIGDKQYAVGEGEKAQEGHSGNFIIEAGKVVSIEGLKADIKSSMKVKSDDIFMTSAKAIKETTYLHAKDRILKDTETTQRSLSLTNQRTDLDIGKELILEGSDDVVLEGVKASVGRNFLVDSGGQFVMTNVKDKTSSEYQHEEKGWDGFSISSTRSSLSFNSHVKEEVDQTSRYQETTIGSEIVVGGAVQTQSKDDTTLIASSLVSNGGFKQTSTDGNVNYLSDLELSSESNEKEKNEFIKSYTIGNAWVEAGHQAVDSVNSLSDAINEDKGSKNGKINAMAKSLNAAISAAQAAKTVKAASDSAATAATYGFKASVGQTASSERHTESVEQSTVKGSMVRSLNGNIVIESNGELTVNGSLVKSDSGSVSIDADVTRLQGKQDTRSEEMRYDYDELGKAMSTAGMELPTVSHQNQSNKKEFRDTQEARIEAGQQVVMKGKELEMIGGLIVASDIDVSGIVDKLTIETMTDSVTERSEGSSYSVGNRMGYSVNSTDQNSELIREQSGLYSQNRVAVDVDHLNLKGGVIHSENAEGLSVRANSLETEDLLVKDSLYSEQVGVGYQGVSRDSLSSQGSSLSVNVANSGHDREYVAKATISDGELVLGSQNGELNRSFDERLKKTKDETLGGLDANVTIETRWLTGTERFVSDENGNMTVEETRGLDEVLGDMKGVVGLVYTPVYGLGGTTKRASQRVGDATSDALMAIKASQSSEIDVISDYKNSTSFRQATLEFQRENPELADILNNKSKEGSAEYNSSMTAYNTYVQKQLGGSNSEVRLYDSNRLRDKETQNGVLKTGMGLTDMDNGSVYVNIATTDISNYSELINVLGHESVHSSGERRESIADRGGEQAQNAWESENKYNGLKAGGGYVDGQDFYDANARDLSVYDGTTLMSKVEDGAAKLYMLTNKVVATDGVDDGIVSKIDQDEWEKMQKEAILADESSRFSDLKSKIRGEFYKNGLIDPNKVAGNNVLKVSEDYEGKEYNLNKPEDFETLRKETEQSYYTENGDDEMWVYMNGMNNNDEGVKNGAELLSNLVGDEVSVIHNDTEGLVGDVLEYLPDSYELKDVLNAKYLSERSQEEETHIVAFSAGNEDLKKALGVMALEDKSLAHNMNVYSVGSPVSKRSLNKAASKVDGDISIVQYNDWKDPVSNPKMWIAGGAVAAVGGAYTVGGLITGVELAVSKLGATMGPFIGSGTAKVVTKWTSLTQTVGMTGPTDFLLQSGTKVVGAGTKIVGAGTKIVGAGASTIGIGVTAKKSTNKYHSLEGYLERDVNGLKRELSDANGRP